MEQSLSRRVGLLVVHGIGEPDPGEMLRSVVDGLETAYGRKTFTEDDNVKVRTTRTAGPDGSEQVSEVRIYEVFWARELGPEKVLGSFDIRRLQQLVWFPWLNWRRVKNFAYEYRLLHVLAWTFVLVPIGAIITAAYQGSQFVLQIIQSMVDGLRESDTLTGLAKRFRTVPILGVVLNTARKDESPGPKRTPLDAFLDTHVCDIFNYVDSAGEANAFVPAAARGIYDVFRNTLQRAVEKDRCTEIQILAHSLGSVITFHALTTYRSDTEELVSLEGPVENRPPLTRVFTIGSPLEKFRFFWPKLIAGRNSRTRHADFQWHNFNSPGDLVAGPLRTYDWVPNISNHSVNGAWGVFTAHTGYRRHPTFLNVFGPAVTAEPVRPQAKWSHPAGRVASGLYESVGIPLLLIALAAVGVVYVYISWAITGWLAGRMISTPIEGARLVLGSSWGMHVLIADWSSTVVGWLGLVLFLPAASYWAYRSGDQTHKDYWSSGFALERRHTVATKGKSVYRDPRFHGILAAQIAILVLIGWIGLRVRPGGQFSRGEAWLLILTLMTTFAVLAGRGLTGYWRGILIDNRNKMSLGRLQLLAWTLVILSAIVTIGITNAAFGAQAALAIQVPQELWVVLGISTASAIAGPAILATKRDKAPDPAELSKTVGELRRGDEVNVDYSLSSVLLRNESFKDARWGDLLKGDESGNAASVDLGKLQMFFFTFVLVLGYAAAIGRLLDGPGAITALPVIDSSMNTLLGISHTGYLANKAAPHSREAQQPSSGAERRAAPRTAEEKV
jgi:hypothetical protein